MRISGSIRKFLSHGSVNDLAFGWVHQSIAAGTKEFSEHRNFIVWHAVVGSLALFGLPVVLAFNSSFGMIEVGIMMAFSLPLFWAYITSSTGRLDIGTIGSLTTFAIAVIGICVLSGGLNSPALTLLCIIPLEAATRLKNHSMSFGFVAVIGSIAAIGLTPFIWTDVPLSNQLDINIGVTGALLTYAFLLAVRHGLFRDRIDGAMAAEQAQFQLISENAADIISCHNSAGLTNFISPASKHLFGVKPTSLLESGFIDKIHVQDRVIFLSQMSAAANSREEQKCQFRVGCESKSSLDWKWVEMMSRSIQNPSSDEFRVLSVTRDISGLKEQERSIQQTAVQVKEANEAQRRFLATMSHEWRTPLNAILGFSDILQQELFGKLPYERHLEYVVLIHESGQHLLNLVNDLLNMSRLECDKYELTIEPFQFVEVVESTIKMLQQLAERNDVVIRHDVLGTLPELNADRRSCQQILINLISNSIKFTEDGGDVVISAKQVGESLEFSVKDNGIGMDEEFLSKIGMPFMQADSGTNRKFEGSGLGISVVKGLVELHDGSLDVQSVKGEGTTITVCLPLISQSVRLVPADEKKSLVHLNQVSREELVSETSTKTKPREGDTRARVSA